MFPQRPPSTRGDTAGTTELKSKWELKLNQQIVIMMLIKET
jgi:hypothetical protein